MGNKITAALEKCGFNRRNASLKQSTRKAPRTDSTHQTVDPKLHGRLTNEDKYTKVKKRKETASDSVHYAEIQVLQSESRNTQKVTPPKDSSTIYATVDFLRGAKPKESPHAADILIPAGRLQNLMVMSQKKSSSSSH